MKAKETSELQLAGLKIRQTRILRDMTQKELADAVGMPKYGDRTIRRWENGESKPTTLELRSILSFPETTPFASPQDADYKIIDLFARANRNTVKPFDL